MFTVYLPSRKFMIIAVLCVAIVSILFASIHIVRSNRAHVVPVAATPVVTEVPPVLTPEPPSTPPQIIRVPLPLEVRGIYWTALTAATKRGDELIDYMQKTGLNAVVIDLKMDDGELAFAPHDKTLEPYAMKKPAIKNIDGLLEKLANDHIYRIARIQVMKDNTFTGEHPDSGMKVASGGLWRDKTGAAWVDPSAPDVASYALALAREAYARGFDEVQFDYVRFASDGKISSITFPFYNGTDLKVDVMKRFFASVGGPLRKEHIPVSFDVFGLVCMTNDGLGIGQRLDGVLASADFVSPMVYPSHYAHGFQGFQNPADHPYDVIKISLDHALGLLLPPNIEISSVKNADGSETTSKKTIPPTKEGLAAAAKPLRPWIQDFDIGAVYTGPMIEAEIKAVRDAGGSGFLIWNARNVYEPANYVK
ncbi:MAG: hypothetical protein NTX72_05960 [Candidatus Uhrbacteria bacterium]|nr:hypothetical protein [Candidatus Uhrbacteria bacterium]